METLKLLEVLVFLFSFFPKFKKLNISLIYWAIIVIFSVSLPMVNLNKFFLKRNFDTTTWRTSRTTSRWRSTKKVRATQNFIKDKMTGRVDILANFWNNCKKVKNEVTGTEKRRFRLIYLKTFHKSTYLGPVTFVILTFLQFSQKCVRLYGPFPSFRLLWKFL